jgi:hypothetical protein
MSKAMSLEEAFKSKGDIEIYIERWEKSKSNSDPLIQKWREYIDKSKKR